MNASRSASGSAESARTDLPDRLGPPDLAPDLVALLLAQRREVAVHVRAGGQRHDRADVLALDVERPALGHLAGPEGRGQRVGGGIAAAQPAQVDDVPGMTAGRVGQVVGERLGDGRQVLGRGQDRGVVGVVRGAEEDRGRGRGRPASARRRSPWRIIVRVSASLGSTSWRCMSGTIATGSARRHRPCTRRASPRGRSPRTRPTRRAGTPSRRRASPTASARPARPRRPAGCRRRGGARRGAGARTGAATEWTRASCSVPEQAGSASRVEGVTRGI